MFNNYKEKIKMEAFAEYLVHIKEDIIKFIDKLKNSDFNENREKFRTEYNQWNARIFYFDRFMQHRYLFQKKGKGLSKEVSYLVLELCELMREVNLIFENNHGDGLNENRQP